MVDKDLGSKLTKGGFFQNLELLINIGYDELSAIENILFHIGDNIIFNNILHVTHVPDVELNGEDINHFF